MCVRASTASLTLTVEQPAVFFNRSPAVSRMLPLAIVSADEQDDWVGRDLLSQLKTHHTFTWKPAQHEVRSVARVRLS